MTADRFRFDDFLLDPGERRLLRAGAPVDADSASQLDFLTLRPDESPQPVGIYLSDETTYRDAMDAIAASLGAWWAFDIAGALRMGQLRAPVEGIAPLLDVWLIHSPRADRLTPSLTLTFSVSGSMEPLA